jgi:2,3-bisphosphoglycerate-independent phosphoglycerate mutase
MPRPRPIILTVLDGWGYSPQREGNAIALARKPNYDRLIQKYPNTLIHTSGPFVGLPDGQMGNSEVGHMTMGAGRIVQMDVTRIDALIANGAFFKNPVLLEAMARGRDHQLHLMGLVSDGGVHSHSDHLFTLLRMARDNNVQRVFVHCFTDGRDTPPESGLGFIERLQNKMRELGVGRIASISGRYYAMDRDNRWERIEKSYNAIVHGRAGAYFNDPLAAMRESYARGVTDEFFVPIVLTDQDPSAPSPAPIATVRDHDAAINFNYRADRARQMTRALVEPGFTAFVDPARPSDLDYVAMTQYDKTWTWLRYVEGSPKLEHILAEVFAALEFKNLRIAETEKYAHVTYFFNGGVEKPFAGEERILIPSPKVATYDLKPEMSAPGIADTVVKMINQRSFDAIIMNFANADMVGHSGNLEAAIKAVESVDACLGEIDNTLRSTGGAWIITADHGNAETMIDPRTGGPHTFHTTNPVPLILASDNYSGPLSTSGSLRDIAPTILGLVGAAAPREMTGRDLRLNAAAPK